MRLLLFATSFLLAGSSLAAAPPKPPGFCAKIEQLLCSGLTLPAEPRDKMTIVAGILAEEDPAFKQVADSISQLAAADRKPALIAGLSKLEGAPFVCKALDAAWDDRAFKCPKAPAPKKLEPCLVAIVSRTPPVKSKKVGSGFVYGKDASGFVTLTLTVKGTQKYLAVDLPELDETICQQLGAGTYVVHGVTKEAAESMTLEVFAPTAPEDLLADLATVCEAANLGVELIPASTAKDKVIIGLHEAFGALTTARYRSVLVHVSSSEVPRVLTMLREDIAKAPAPRKSCALLDAHAD